MNVTLYHNPRCSKSRKTLELLKQRGIDPEIVEYLQTCPDVETISSLLQKLGMQVEAIMRTGEPEYKEASEAIQKMSEQERRQWLAEHPKVLERPIVVAGEQARIGRPPESVLEILP